MFFQLNDNTLLNLNYVISVTKRNYSTGTNRYGIEFLVTDSQKYEKYFEKEETRDLFFTYLLGFK